MLNEERVILMTKMASYEQGEGQKNLEIGKFFRSDYIAIQVMKAVCCATVAFAIGFALYIFYDFEEFMQNIYKIDLLGFAKNVLSYYAMFVIGYGVVTYLLCAYRYAKAKSNLRKYYQNLRKLGNLYKEKE